MEVRKILREFWKERTTLLYFWFLRCNNISLFRRSLWLMRYCILMMWSTRRSWISRFHNHFVDRIIECSTTQHHTAPYNTTPHHTAQHSTAQQERKFFTLTKRPSVPIKGECDVRFLYCACAVSALLDDWSGVNKKAAVQYILSCVTYEGGTSLVPGKYWCPFPQCASMIISTYMH